MCRVSYIRHHQLSDNFSLTLNDLILDNYVIQKHTYYKRLQLVFWLQLQHWCTTLLHQNFTFEIVSTPLVLILVPLMEVLSKRVEC